MVIACEPVLAGRFTDARQEGALGRDAEVAHFRRPGHQGLPIRRIRHIADQALTGLSPHLSSGSTQETPELQSRRNTCLRLRFGRQVKDVQRKPVLRTPAMQPVVRVLPGLNVLGRRFDHSVFSKNRPRLLYCDTAREFLLAILQRAREQRLLSEGHSCVDGTLLKARLS